MNAALPPPLDEHTFAARLWGVSDTTIPPDLGSMPVAQPTAEERPFQVVSEFAPAGDQPKAIAALACRSGPDHFHVAPSADFSWHACPAPAQSGY